MLVDCLWVFVSILVCGKLLAKPMVVFPCWGPFVCCECLSLCASCRPCVGSWWSWWNQWIMWPRSACCSCSSSSPSGDRKAQQATHTSHSVYSIYLIISLKSQLLPLQTSPRVFSMLQDDSRLCPKLTKTSIFYTESVTCVVTETFAIKIPLHVIKY